MLAKRFAELALAAALIVGNAAYAGPLTGKTLSATNSAGTFSPATTAAVGSGVEFTADFSSIPFFSIDFDENGLVTVTDILGGGLGHGAGQLLSFFDVFAEIGPIVGFNFVSSSGVTGIDQSDLSFTANSIAMEVGSGTSWVTGDTFTAQIQFAPVPEPASMALLAIGLAGIAMSGKRKKSS